MIVDTSALIAIIDEEPAADELKLKLASDPHPKISAATLLEYYAVADARYAGAHRSRIDALLREAELEVTPFTAEHAGVAREAYRVFGKGSGSRARLNFGDCFSYALAAVTGEPLLFVGDDFTHTDVRSAL